MTIKLAVIPKRVTAFFIPFNPAFLHYQDLIFIISPNLLNLLNHATINLL